MTAYALLAFVLLVAATHLVTRPFLLRTVELAEEPEIPALALEKDRLVELIRDLDMDFATGKLNESDYRRLRARDAAEAASLLRTLAEQEAAEQASAAQAPGADQELERRIAARRAALAAAQETGVVPVGR